MCYTIASKAWTVLAKVALEQKRYESNSPEFAAFVHGSLITVWVCEAIEEGKSRSLSTLNRNLLKHHY